MSTAYFKVLFGDQGTWGVAHTIEQRELFSLPLSGRVEDWMPFALELRDGEFVDYLASDLGCRLCSGKMRDILQRHASPKDELQWLPVNVFRGDEQRSYAILHFPNPPDVLDKRGTLFAGDFVVKPVLFVEALHLHDVFSFPNGGDLRLCVSEVVKRGTCRR